MTIGDWIKANGWNFDCCGKKTGKVMTVDISFTHSNVYDETSFDINAYDLAELTNLFQEFCEENDLSDILVTNVRVTAMANSFEELN